MANPILSPLDVVDGASVKGRKGVYVLGCYDQRITFYSQQVRALALVHALAEQDYLRDSPRIAVIGGGAAGITAAAAAALASKGEVVLFEAAGDLLKLQMGTDRRKLDPHIYNWPRSNAGDPIADLPILSWEAGPSRDVREDVVRQFDDIAGQTGNLVQLKRHRVTAVSEIDGGGYGGRQTGDRHLLPAVQRRIGVRTQCGGQASRFRDDGEAAPFRSGDV